MNNSAYPICALQDLPIGKRKHFEFDNRLVTVLNHNNKIYCIDTVCYHGGGPLGFGEIQEIEELGSIPSIKCEWHSYCVSLDEGRRVYQSCVNENGRLKPGGWTLGERVQRTHKIDVLNNTIHIHLNRSGKFRSDDYDGHSNPSTFANIRSMLQGQHSFSCSRVDCTLENIAKTR